MAVSQAPQQQASPGGPRRSPSPPPALAGTKPHAGGRRDATGTGRPGHGPPMQHLNYDGSPLAYIDEGSGPVTVVAIPGLPGTSRDFRHLAPHLAAHLRLIRVDLPGYGGSPRPAFAGMTISQRARPVQTLIEELRLAPVVLLSHSAGAHVVAHLSHHHPHLVRSCVLLAPPGPHLVYPQWCFRGWSLLLHMPAGRRIWAPLVRAVQNAAGYQHRLTDDERAHPVLDDSVVDLGEHAADLAGMRHPAMVASARDDPILHAEWFREVESLVPHGPRLHYDHGGHAIQKTHANELGPAIVNFALADTEETRHSPQARRQHTDPRRT